MRTKQSSLPKYEGDLPYIYFAFSSENISKVQPVLHVLLSHGFRVWFETGLAGNAAELQRRQQRSKGAAVTLLYLSQAEERDIDLKSILLNNQKAGKPVLVLDSDGEDRFLAMNLRENTPAIDLRNLSTPDRLEASLLHSGLLTQELIGEPITLAGRPKLLPVAALCLAVVLLVMAGISVFLQGKNSEPEVFLEDPVLYAAALEATGDNRLTDTKLSTITELHFDSLPQNWEELNRLPALERLVIEQDCITDAEILPTGYVILLSGGKAG